MADVQPEKLHTEMFQESEPKAERNGFTVVLARSGREIFVAEGTTILDALLTAGIDAAFSCTQGVCGTCEVGLIAGIADHMDYVLSDEQRNAHKSIMICCSGSKSDRLVLDL